MSKFDWQVIQEDYNKGLSYRDLQAKYGMSSRTLTLAQRRGDLITRSRSEATLVCKRPPTKHTEQWKAGQSARILARYETGWMPRAGRCKKIRYSSPIAGEVSLDGTWELAVAEYLDRNSVKWQRNTKRFPYLDRKGKLRHYTPDFWIDDWNSFLEVKGYETDLDRCKWSQFAEPLIVWKRIDIEKLRTCG